MERYEYHIRVREENKEKFDELKKYFSEQWTGIKQADHFSAAGMFNLMIVVMHELFVEENTRTTRKQRIFSERRAALNRSLFKDPVSDRLLKKTDYMDKELQMILYAVLFTVQHTATNMAPESIAMFLNDIGSVKDQSSENNVIYRHMAEAVKNDLDSNKSRHVEGKID